MNCYQQLFLLLLLVATPGLHAQTNMFFTNPAIMPVLQGDYDPADYASQEIWDSPEELVSLLAGAVSADSLRSYLEHLSTFGTRNTASDTLSPDRGIGAARNWALYKFDQFDQRQGGRLETGFFQFDEDICWMGRHRNIVALLPGTDPDAGLIIAEAHIDSRCYQPCNAECLAQGMEDNGSGTALVMEMARVMSTFSFPNSFLFVLTTGEEQGLRGARALAEYLLNGEIPVKLVQNNDIVGGIICGKTSSPPSCPGENAIDSTQVRLFSHGGFNSPHKALCRYIKLQYEEMLEPIAPVPMRLTVMTNEDRQGRGGDHIPFRMRGYPAMRFTSAHEHGDASGGADYMDRQHTSDDILGLDLDEDGELDTFFVDFNYLARNTAINITAAAMASISPRRPVIEDAYYNGDSFYISISSPVEYPRYVIGIRTDFHEFDSLYYLEGRTDGFFRTAGRELSIFLSVAAIDSNGIESLFSEEHLSFLSGVSQPDQRREKPVRLLANRPNPFDEATTLSFYAENAISYDNAHLAIHDMQGKCVAKIDTEVLPGLNEVIYHHGYGMSGQLVQMLVIDGEVVDSRAMVFAN